MSLYKTHTESVLRDLYSIRKRLDRLSEEILAEPDMLASDLATEIAMEIEGSANQVTEAIVARSK